MSRHSFASSIRHGAHIFAVQSVVFHRSVAYETSPRWASIQNDARSRWVWPADFDLPTIFGSHVVDSGVFRFLCSYRLFIGPTPAGLASRGMSIQIPVNPGFRRCTEGGNLEYGGGARRCFALISQNRDRGQWTLACATSCVRSIHCRLASTVRPSVQYVSGRLGVASRACRVVRGTPLPPSKAIGARRRVPCSG